MKMIKYIALLLVFITVIGSFLGCTTKDGEKNGSGSDKNKKPEGGKAVYSFNIKQINNYGQMTTLLLIQGMVNKKDDPKLFLVGGGAYRPDNDQEWKDYYEKEMGYTFEDIATFDDVIEKFKDNFKSIITYSQDVVSYNGWIRPHADLASVISSVSDCLPVPKPNAERIAAKIGLPIAETVTVKKDGQTKEIPGDLDKLNLNTGTDVYEWMFENLKDFTSSSEYLFLDSSALDLAAQRKMMCFDLEPRKGNPKDEALIKKINDHFNSKNDLFTVWGWVEDEDLGVAYIAERGGVLKCVGFNNLSFYATTPVTSDDKTYKQKTGIDVSKVKYDENKFYVTFMASEADAPKTPATMQYGAWFDENRGKVPINWGVMPQMIEDFPILAKRHYDEATPKDYIFTSAQSFMGFTDLAGLPEKSYNAIVEISKRLTKLSDQYMLDLYSDYSVFKRINEHKERYSDFAKKTGLFGYTGRNETEGNPMNTQLIKFPDDVLLVRRPIMYPERKSIGISKVKNEVINGNPQIGFSSITTDTSENYFISGDKNYDYTYFSTKINISSGTNGTIAFRLFVSDDRKSFYEYRISNGFKHELIKIENGKETVLESATKALTPKTVYPLNFVVDGEKLTVYTDSERLVTAQDKSLKSGKIGIYTNNISVDFADTGFSDQPIWKERYDDIVKDTVGTGNKGGFSVGYYGLLMDDDYTKAQMRIEPPPYAAGGGTSTVSMSPKDIKRIIDELNKNYPGKFVFTTLDEFMGAAIKSLK